MNDVSEITHDIENSFKLNTLLSRAALRHHALKVSQQCRQGKFTRVSQEFMDNVEAAIDSKLRSLLAGVSNPYGQVEPEKTFLTPAGRRKLLASFEKFIAREVHRQADKIRVGKTL